MQPRRSTPKRRVPPCRLLQHVSLRGGVSTERQQRQATFDQLRQRLFPLLEALERCADGELETEVVWAADDCRLPLTEGNLDAMERRLQALQAEEAANKAEAERLRARLGQLWARLEVSAIRHGVRRCKGDVWGVSCKTA